MKNAPTQPDPNEPADNSTTKLLDDVVVERVMSVRFQISDRIRQMIKAKELRPGEKLPATRTLAERLEVDPTAVHRALAQLVKEGLLMRSRHLGTYVAEPVAGLQRLAFYYRPIGHDSGLSQALLVQLTRLGREEGFSVEVFGDTRPHEESNVEPPAELKRLVHTRWVQGVVADAPPQRVKWVNTLPVPHAALSNPDVPHTISWRRDLQAAMAVRQLVSRGCRRIGAITPLLMAEQPGADSYQLGFLRGVRNGLEEAGLPFNPAWSRGIPALDFKLSERQHPAFGYQAVMRIWEQTPPDERPDGLYIYPDVVAGGALQALSKLGVAIPDDCHLVLHANAELPLFCPFPVDRLVVKVEDAARAMLAHIRDQMAGVEKRPDTLPSYIEPHTDEHEANEPTFFP